MKRCIKCDQLLELESFRLDKQGRNGKSNVYLRPECKLCEKRLSDQLKRARLQATNKPLVCECCKEPSRLVVDHDHNTGDFRGWLCRRCNLGIGRLGDNLEGIINAANYLLSR